MDDTITPRESLENDMPTPLFMFRQTEKVERDKDGVVYYGKHILLNPQLFILH